MMSPSSWIIRVCSGNTNKVDDVNQYNQEWSIMNKIISIVPFIKFKECKDLELVYKCSDVINYEQRGWYMFSNLVQIDYNKIALLAVGGLSDELDPYGLIYEIQKDGSLIFCGKNDREFYEHEGILNQIGFKTFISFLEKDEKNQDNNFDDFGDQVNSFNIFDLRSNSIVYSCPCGNDSKQWLISRNKVLFQNQFQPQLIYTIDEEERKVCKIDDVSDLFQSGESTLIMEADEWTNDLSVWIIEVSKHRTGCLVDRMCKICIYNDKTQKIFTIHEFDALSMTNITMINTKILSPREFSIFMMIKLESIIISIETKDDHKTWSIKTDYITSYNQWLKLASKEDKEKEDKYDQVIIVKNYVEIFQKFRKFLYQHLCKYILCDLVDLIYDYCPYNYILKISSSLD